MGRLRALVTLSSLSIASPKSSLLSPVGLIICTLSPFPPQKHPLPRCPVRRLLPGGISFPLSSHFPHHLRPLHSIHLPPPILPPQMHLPPSPRRRTPDHPPLLARQPVLTIDLHSRTFRRREIPHQLPHPAPRLAQLSRPHSLPLHLLLAPAGLLPPGPEPPAADRDP